MVTGGIFVFLIGMYFRATIPVDWDSDLLKRAASHGSSAIGYMEDFVRALRADRKSLFGESLLRSLGLRRRGGIDRRPLYPQVGPPCLSPGGLGSAVFADVMAIDLRYLNDDNYMERDDYQQNFEPTKADKQIQDDKGYFRVLDLRDSLSNSLTYGAMTAYFHLSIGGYHAAKLKIYDDLINRQLYNYPQLRAGDRYAEYKIYYQTQQDRR